jgi:arylsulfatase A-like enzyme
VRVPFVVSWPGKLPAGKSYEQPVSSVDVFATALACAGVPMPADKIYDSVDLLPFLSGEKSGAPHERLYWRDGAQLAARQGSSKLVRHASQTDELYDLVADLAETNNLAPTHSETAKPLGAALDAWDKELVPPAFPGTGAARAAKKNALSPD